MTDFWRPSNNPGYGVTDQINAMIGDGMKSGKLNIPDLRGSKRIMLLSDYRDADSNCDFDIIALAFVDAHSLPEWERGRRAWRNSWLPDGRRLAYKSLAGDDLKLKSLPGFLSLADHLHGLLVVVAVHKQITALTSENGPLFPVRDQHGMMSRWKKHTLEKATRILHFVNFFLAGVTHPDQEVFWITDVDEVVANDERRVEFCRFADVFSDAYLPHKIRIRIATTAQDDGTRLAEDSVSLSDLAAGALGEVLTNHHRAGGPTQFVEIEGLSEKADAILDWYIDQESSLGRLTIALTPGASPGSVSFWLPTYGRWQEGSSYDSRSPSTN